MLLDKQHTDLGALRAVVVNSGNANAATGSRGLDDAAKMQGGAAIACGVSESGVAVASTGVIGVPLPMDAITRGTLAAAHALRADGDATSPRRSARPTRSRSASRSIVALGGRDACG